MKKTKRGYCSGTETTVAYKYQLNSFFLPFSVHSSPYPSQRLREFHTHQRRPISVRRRRRAEVRNPITKEENPSPMPACALPSEQGYCLASLQRHNSQQRGPPES